MKINDAIDSWYSLHKFNPSLNRIRNIDYYIRLSERWPFKLSLTFRLHFACLKLLFKLKIVGIQKGQNLKARVAFQNHDLKLKWGDSYDYIIISLLMISNGLNLTNNVLSVIAVTGAHCKVTFPLSHRLLMSGQRHLSNEARELHRLTVNAYVSKKTGKSFKRFNDI